MTTGRPGRIVFYKCSKCGMIGKRKFHPGTKAPDTRPCWKCDGTRRRLRREGR